MSGADDAHKLTSDAFLGGALDILQPASGYRAGLDAVLLAAACGARTGDGARVLDAGAGVGVAGLCLARRVADADVTLVEREPVLAGLARENIVRNALAERVHVVELDITEGGASIFDFDGRIEQATDEYLRLHPEAGYDEVVENVLAPFEGNVVHRAFTPRLLEAIALRTALVLFPGEYAGIIKPWRHYVPLNRDFSNSEEVATALRDDRLLQEMVDRAYHEIACSPEFSYSRFVSRFDVAVDLAMQNMRDIALHASHRPVGATRSAALRARLALHELPGRARRLLEYGRRHVAGAVPASVRRFLRRRRVDNS